MKYAVLRDEFHSESVLVWNLDNLRKQTLPVGTKVRILSLPTLAGYVAIQVGTQVLEARQECLVASNDAQSQRLN